ncbi:hypothetical protein GQX74_013987 [Glossina fuscipes]|uniref:Uncharacterized protein n=1 Tax=Glossina palpalis gambiensis TaxID=67801 RepID=A0A1B0B6I2_9MUSC|nr:hypothetical protein GQX74_013987 [Glossina fuscipes]
MAEDSLSSRGFFKMLTFFPAPTGTKPLLKSTTDLVKLAFSVPDMSTPRFSIVSRNFVTERSRTLACLWRGIAGLFFLEANRLSSRKSKRLAPSLDKMQIFLPYLSIK